MIRKQTHEKCKTQHPTIITIHFDLHFFPLYFNEILWDKLGVSLSEFMESLSCWNVQDSIFDPYQKCFSKFVHSSFFQSLEVRWYHVLKITALHHDAPSSKLHCCNCAFRWCRMSFCSSKHLVWNFGLIRPHFILSVFYCFNQMFLYKLVVLCNKCA